MKRDILYVDDEIENLVVFQATFDEYFNVVTADSGAEALRLLESRPFPVVIADQRMPRMTGAELFAVMRERFPQTKRVMLTGYADPSAMLDSINQGQVFYFVKKPWEQDVVMSVVIRAIEAYDLAVSNRVLTDRLVAADRCAMLGRSAAQLAHELGNQLFMLPLVEMVEEKYASDQDLMQLASFARATHDRLVQIINEVKNFVRFEREQGLHQKVLLSEVIQELREFLRFERSVPLATLGFEVQSSPCVRADRVKLQQVLLNLVKNAAFAVRGKADGRITVRLATVGDQAELVVADNGCGMSAEVAGRIWEPFFTTKGDEGTGLGLDVTKGIVESHGGTIECQTTLGQGAIFTIRLPVISAAQDASDEVDSAAPRAITAAGFNLSNELAATSAASL
jgi:two-component system sensor histidine kinase/response regulator